MSFEVKVTNGGTPGVFSIPVPSIIKWVGGIFGGLFVGVGIAAITGNVAMYGQVRELNATMAGLTETVDNLAKATEAQLEQRRIETEMLKLNHEVLKNRLTAIDRQVP